MIGIGGNFKTYAAPFWSETMSVQGWKKMAAVHRQSQLRAACCYSTVSYETSAVVSDIPPIQLLARERTAVFHGKNRIEARNEVFNNWQKEWEESSKGRWTFRLIKNVGKWHARSYGEVCFHTTQVLTGHGCFAAYLKTFNIQSSDACAQCGLAPDDAEHAFFRCDAWETWRRQTYGEMDVEELTPENVVDTMMSSQTRWNLISKLMTRVMKTRKEEERFRQSQPT